MRVSGLILYVAVGPRGDDSIRVAVGGRLAAHTHDSEDEQAKVRSTGLSPSASRTSACLTDSFSLSLVLASASHHGVGKANETCWAEPAGAWVPI